MSYPDNTGTQTMLNLFPPEDTTIICKTKDGKKIEVDALDLDDMAIRVYVDAGWPKEMPQLEYLIRMCDLFHEKYNYLMSKASMNELLEEKAKILNSIKKNTYPSPVPTSSTVSSLQPTEN